MAQNEDGASTQSERQLLDEIKRQGAQVSKLKIKWEEQKEKALEAKHAYHDAEKKLLALTGAANDDETPLVDRMDADGWRKVKLVDVLSAPVLKAVTKAKRFANLGALHKYREKHSLTSLPNIGGMTSDAVDEEVSKFIAKNPQWQVDFGKAPTWV